MRLRTVAAAAIAALAFAPSVSAANDPLRGQQWGLSMIESDAAHSTTDGGGALVAVVDSGVDSAHGDLQGRLTLGRDFVDGDGAPQDGDGHGTHVTGIVAANAGNGVGVSSVAPGATVLAVRVLGNDGSGTVDHVAGGIDYAVAQGAQVINLSLGEDLIIGDDQAYADAIGRALDRGVVVVGAAGNNGLPVCEQPSGQGRLLCVGAVDRCRNRTYYSSFGSGLGIVAPGGAGLTCPDEILSTWNGGGYKAISGTSQAAPHVAGVAGLLASRGVRGQEAVNRILATASDAGPSGPDPQYGAGIVNARQAVAGLPGPGGGPGADSGSRRPSSAARVSVSRRMRIRSVLRRGIPVRCLASGAGRCVAVARRKRLRLAAGSARVRAGRIATVLARPTKRGRRVLRRALRRRARMRVKVAVSLPGAPRVVRRVLLVP
jgi:thermitase